MLFKSLIRLPSQLILPRIKQAYHLLLPPTCVLCGLTTHCADNLCLACQQDLPILPHHCPQCAQFMPLLEEFGNLLCGNCLSSPPPFEQTYALFPYETPIIQLITQLKFHHQLSHAKALGDLLLSKINSQWYTAQPLPDLILPMPLHPKRLTERGFNQALEIARPLAKALHIPLDIHGIQRRKATLPQSALPARKRKINISHAFHASRDYTGLSIAVLDDVITTGHTMRECCRLLKNQGASRIHVWCCARRG